MREYRQICDALGEVLWIMDDLVDLEEDLDRGIWNRSLWRIYDDIGGVRFQEVITSKGQLALEIQDHCWVAEEINAIDNRITFLENHPLNTHPGKVRAFMSFWITSGMGIYR